MVVTESLLRRAHVITELNDVTGEATWRFGGKNSLGREASECAGLASETSSGFLRCYKKNGISENKRRVMREVREEKQAGSRLCTLQTTEAVWMLF